MSLKSKRNHSALKKALVMTTVAALSVPAFATTTDEAPVNLVSNPSLDSNGWEAVNEAGIQKRNAREGQNSFYMNAGVNNQVKQKVTIPRTGTYTLSVWLNTGNNESASLRIVDANTGEVLASCNADGNKTCQGYTQCQVEGVALEEGREVDITFGGISNAWVNGDEATFYNEEDKDNLLQNGGFEIPNWEFINNASIADGNSKTGKYHFCLNAGTENEVRQHVEVSEAGTYTASAWFLSAADNGRFQIIDSSTGNVLASETIGNSESYTAYTLEPVQLEAGQGVDIVCAGGNGQINGDDVSLSTGTGSIVDPTHPIDEITDKYDVLDFEENADNVIRRNGEEGAITFDFDDMTDEDKLGWSTQEYRDDAIYEISPNGRNHSKCLAITANTKNDAKWIKQVQLEPNKCYLITGYIKGEGLKMEHSVGANICVNGSWIHSDQLENVTGDFDWTPVKFLYRAEGDGMTTIGCRIGYWNDTASGKVYFDDIKISEPADVIEGKYARIYLDSDTAEGNISDENLKGLVHHLDNAYVGYKNLVGMAPFEENKISVVISDKDFAPAWAGNPINWSRPGIASELKRIDAAENWSFCLLHEMGHNFDVTYGDKKDCGWNCHAELFANFKMAYILERLNGVIYQDKRCTPSEIQDYLNGDKTYNYFYKGGDLYKVIPYRGKEIEEYYRNDAQCAYTQNIAVGKGTFNNFNDGLTYCLLRIKNKIGWEPFQLTFREFVEEDIQPKTRLDKFDKFLEVLQKNYNEGGTEVYDTFKDGELEFIRNVLEND